MDDVVIYSGQVSQLTQAEFACIPEIAYAVGDVLHEFVSLVVSSPECIAKGDNEQHFR